jgi:DNA-binding response OmpR family regulator
MTHTSQKLRKILIIDDEGDLCLLLELLLKNDNTAIEHAKTLERAKDLLEKEKPDLVLLDNRLPDGLGIDFIPYIKSNYPTIRIVMISGKDISAKDIALETGANIFLSKPFTREQLVSSIQLLLN